MERFLRVPHRIFLQLLRLSKREHCPAVIPVYLALLYHADSQGRCFPGYRRIMEISGVGSERTVAKALKILKREGLVLVDTSHGKHGSNRYLLPTLLSKDLNFTEESLKLYSVKSQTLLSKDELYPINYNQLTKYLSNGERESGTSRDLKREVENILGRKLYPHEEMILSRYPGDILKALKEVQVENPEAILEQGLFAVTGGRLP